jgi:DNA-binding FadR family transcriptional regulator
LEHLAEFRIKIEGSIAELAALRATHDDILKMEQLFEQAKTCFENQDWEKFLKIDEAMHIYIGAMSQNPVCQFVQKCIHENIHPYYQDYLPMNHERTLENLNDFRQIIDALKINDSKAASHIIMDHVERFYKKMEKNTEKNNDPDI